MFPILLHCHTKPFWKAAYSKWKEVPPIGSKLFPLKEDNFSEGSNNNSAWITSPESLYIPFTSKKKKKKEESERLSLNNNILSTISTCSCAVKFINMDSEQKQFHEHKNVQSQSSAVPISARNVKLQLHIYQKSTVS